MRSFKASTESTKDDEIIRQTLEGDQNAFAQLILKYKDSLFDMACRILGNRSEAEDVLQEAFIEAYRHLSDFNHQARFSTWLYSIVLNRTRNHLRHNKIVQWRSLDGFNSPNDDEIPPEMPERGPSASKILEHKLDLEALQKEVHLLQPLHQSIFILHYFQDIPLEEVSRRLNRPIGTIKVYLHRARKQLYKKLSLNNSELQNRSYADPVRLPSYAGA